MKTLLRQIYEASHSHSIPVKMMSFAVIGAGNTVIDFGVFTLAYKTLELPLVPSNVLAWLVAVSGSYVMNTLITFRTETKQTLRGKDYLKFVASGILGMCAATTTLVVLSHYVQVFAAKLVSILVSFGVNFAMSHFVVFRPKIPTNSV